MHLHRPRTRQHAAANCLPPGYDHRPGPGLRLRPGRLHGRRRRYRQLHGGGEHHPDPGPRGRGDLHRGRYPGRTHPDGRRSQRQHHPVPDHHHPGRHHLPHHPLPGPGYRTRRRGLQRHRPRLPGPGRTGRQLYGPGRPGRHPGPGTEYRLRRGRPDGNHYPDGGRRQRQLRQLFLHPDAGGPRATDHYLPPEPGNLRRRKLHHGTARLHRVGYGRRQLYPGSKHHRKPVGRGRGSRVFWPGHPDRHPDGRRRQRQHERLLLQRNGQRQYAPRTPLPPPPRRSRRRRLHGHHPGLPGQHQRGRQLRPPQPRRRSRYPHPVPPARGNLPRTGRDPGRHPYRPGPEWQHHRLHHHRNPGGHHPADHRLPGRHHPGPGRHLRGHPARLPRPGRGCRQLHPRRRADDHPVPPGWHPPGAGGRPHPRHPDGNRRPRQRSRLRLRRGPDRYPAAGRRLPGQRYHLRRGPLRDRPTRLHGAGPADGQLLRPGKHHHRPTARPRHRPEWRRYRTNRDAGRHRRSRQRRQLPVHRRPGGHHRADDHLPGGSGTHRGRQLLRPPARLHRRQREQPVRPGGDHHRGAAATRRHPTERGQHRAGGDPGGHRRQRQPG